MLKDGRESVELIASKPPFRLKYYFGKRFDT